MKDKGKPAVIIPLDGSRTSTVALGAAQALTGIMGGILHIVHVTDAPLPEEDLPGHLKVEEVFDHFHHQLSGDIVGSILEFALEIDARMVVMSSHGQTYDDRDLVGSKTQGLLRHATIPTMVIRPGMENLPGASWKPRKILVPLDGAPLPAAVVNEVFDLAEILGAEIDVLHIAVSGKEPPSEAGTYTSPRYLDHPHYDWPAWADEFTKRLFAHRLPEVGLRLFHEPGDPVEVTLRFALENDEDIIALSWRGRMGKKHAATVQGILRSTERPILLVRKL
jgi:nucleotide-binding universal stress UspA family protein